ncbi:hypothetical protein [Aeromonas bestiarum]|uniref:hypothetical protein n=1 Tax=Aeromonas bestiarum TaxID=105751 RepID=UPI00104049E6|nr:hypothetical protein [Aeromonas bestiarum]
MLMQVTQEELIQAINTTLKDMSPEGQPISTLETDEKSKGWSCNDFGPLLLTKIGKMKGIENVDDLPAKGYDNKPEVILPPSFEDKAFYNISMMGEPSYFNHNFNICISGDFTYIIQAFVNKNVRIVSKLENQDFINAWHKLGLENEWQDSYLKLFSVHPRDVEQSPPEAPRQDPPKKSWLNEQYVTALVK